MSMGVFEKHVAKNSKQDLVAGSGRLKRHATQRDAMWGGNEFVREF
jgi:hypothetical protein